MLSTDVFVVPALAPQPKVLSAIVVCSVMTCRDTLMNEIWSVRTTRPLPRWRSIGALLHAVLDGLLLKYLRDWSAQCWCVQRRSPARRPRAPLCTHARADLSLKVRRLCGVCAARALRCILLCTAPAPLGARGRAVRCCTCTAPPATAPHTCAAAGNTPPSHIINLDGVCVCASTYICRQSKLRGNQSKLLGNQSKLLRELEACMWVGGWVGGWVHTYAYVAMAPRGCAPVLARRMRV